MTFTTILVALGALFIFLGVTRAKKWWQKLLALFVGSVFALIGSSSSTIVLATVLVALGGLFIFLGVAQASRWWQKLPAFLVGGIFVFVGSVGFIESENSSTDNTTQPLTKPKEESPN
jgi:zinc transporter ZupT